MSMFYGIYVITSMTVKVSRCISGPLVTKKMSSYDVTGPLWGESTSDRWIPLTKASEPELWWFLWSALEQRVEQTIEAPVIWDAMVLIMTSLYCFEYIWEQMIVIYRGLDGNIFTQWGKVKYICNWAIIGSDNDLLPVWQEPIIWASAGLFFNWINRNRMQWNLSQQRRLFIQINKFENVICKILSWPQWVNWVIAAIQWLCVRTIHQQECCK